MQTNRVVDLLRSIPGLAAASTKSLSDLVPLVDEVTLLPGQFLTKQGHRGRQAFIVADGIGRVYVNGQQKNSVCAGDFVGEVAMLDGGPRSATVQAITDMHVLVIGPQAFETFVRHEGVAHAIAEQLSRRLRKTENCAS